MFNHILLLCISMNVWRGIITYKKNIRSKTIIHIKSFLSTSGCCNLADLGISCQNNSKDFCYRSKVTFVRTQFLRIYKKDEMTILKDT